MINEILTLFFLISTGELTSRQKEEEAPMDLYSLLSVSQTAYPQMKTISTFSASAHIFTVNRT